MGNMYESTIIEGVELFKDSSFKNSWNDRDGIKEPLFKIEFKGQKARVYSNVAFPIKPKSRFNKVRLIGSSQGGGVPSVYRYELIALGKTVFFSTNHLIYK